MQYGQLIFGCSMLAIVFGYFVYKARTNPTKDFDFISSFAHKRTATQADRKLLESTTWLGGYLRNSNNMVHDVSAAASLEGVSVKFLLAGSWGGPEVVILGRRSSRDPTAGIQGVINCIGYKPRVDVTQMTKEYAEALDDRRFRVWRIGVEPLPSQAQMRSCAETIHRIEQHLAPGKMYTLEIGPEYVVALCTFKSLKGSSDGMKQAAIEVARLCKEAWPVTQSEM